VHFHSLQSCFLFKFHSRALSLMSTFIQVQFLSMRNTLSNFTNSGCNQHVRVGRFSCRAYNCKIEITVKDQTLISQLRDLILLRAHHPNTIKGLNMLRLCVAARHLRVMSGVHKRILSSSAFCLQKEKLADIKDNIYTIPNALCIAR
jgi:hypothetical protein